MTITRSPVLMMEFLREAYLPSRIEVSTGYAEALAITVRKYSAYLGHPASTDDLAEPTIAAFLMDYRGHWSARSTNNRRAHLVTLWNAAFDSSLIARLPITRRIKKLRSRPDPPLAWTTDEIGQLLAYCACLQGQMCGIPRSLWWGALFSAIYWTGCRIAAMMAATSDCYSAGKGLLVKNQKNKRPQWYPLPTVCCATIEATWPHGRRLLFPYGKTRCKLFADARKIIEAAGLDCPRHAGLGLFHRLRRTTITYCWAVDPALAQRQAGHQSAATTLRSYVDPRIAGQRSAADVLPDPVADQPIYASRRFRIYG